ncbi:MAG: hypothetical protein ACRDCG_01285, partial [Mycoplasmoidaceae bacterium]
FFIFLIVFINYILIGLLVIGLETNKRRSLINIKYNINVNKPNFEYRNPNLQLKNKNIHH